MLKLYFWDLGLQRRSEGILFALSGTVWANQTFEHQSINFRHKTVIKMPGKITVQFQCTLLSPALFWRTFSSTLCSVNFFETGRTRLFISVHSMTHPKHQCLFCIDIRSCFWLHFQPTWKCSWQSRLFCASLLSSAIKIIKFSSSDGLT